ncbi:hypothetical protein ACIQKB_19340 [Streptomyces sp. NPDC092046]|uniref:hypothetical protein n=1 Tax=Streptomyces sp. NPDC092046 TaxID=3366009 RepID=UPI0037F65CAF
MLHRPNPGAEAAEEKKRFDLSVPQVAGSAVAAVVAAKLASTLGVYGTILGAGVISVIATCGGPLLQHLFKRTGEQMHAATTAPRPKGPQTPGRYGEEPYGVPYGEEFGAPTTHGTRVRGWKRSAVGAAAVFLLAMGGITAYELTSGQDLSGTKGTTTFGSAVRGDGGSRNEERSEPGVTPSSTPGGDGRQERKDGGTPTPGDTPSAPATPDTTPTPTPTPTPSKSTGLTDGGTTPPPTTPPTTAPPAPPTAEDPADGAAE